MNRIFIAGVLILFSAMVQAQNVGIGTATPVARLQINHRSSTTVGLQLLDSTPFRSGKIRFSTINNPVGIIMEGAYESSFNKDHYLDISSDSVFIATFRGDGNVGIGTFHPTAKLEVSSTSQGFLPPRMDSTQRNAIVSPASGLTIYNTTINAFQVYNGTKWYSTVHFIGENYGGGIVFYVYDNGQHGLIAATADLLGLQWYNGTYRYTGTTGDGLGAGAMNTAIIIATQMADNQTGNFAAKACADYSVTAGGITYGDWYLPSKYELNLLYLQKAVVGGFVNSNVWSSSEFSSVQAWYQQFLFGTQIAADKGNDVFRVRPVRAF